MNSKGKDVKEVLSGYFKYYCENLFDQDERWFETLSEWIRFFDKLKNKTATKDNSSNRTEEFVESFKNVINETKKYKNNSILDSLFPNNDISNEDIYRVLFKTQDNGIGNISRSVVAVKDFDKDTANNAFRVISELLKLKVNGAYSKESSKIAEKAVELAYIIKQENSTPYAVVHRLLRAIFYDMLTPLDPKDEHLHLKRKLQELEEDFANSKCDKNDFNDYDYIGIDKKSDEKYLEYLKNMTKFFCDKIEFEKKLMEQSDGFECIFQNKEIEVDWSDPIEKSAVKQMFYWNLAEMFNPDLVTTKLKVYYGAPGTGKTYKAKKVANEIIGKWELRTQAKLTDKASHIQVVQFHPSFGYEDFIEGIRPKRDEGFEVVDGIFREFCKKAGQIEMELWKNEKFNKEEFKDKSFCEINYDELPDDAKDIFDRGLKAVMAFGSGPNEEKKTIDGETKSKMTLEELLPPYVFIIDEINRAELAKVFGELMYAFEYRGYGGKIKTQYSYMRTEEDAYYWENGEDYFFIPHNVYILATMNTIDRSVDIFDFAMRRRFTWERAEVDYGVISSELNGKGIVNKKDQSIGDELAESLKKINEKIKNNSLLGEDYEIGHAYVLQVAKCPREFDDVKDVKEYLWEYSLRPLLEEYLKGLTDGKQVQDMLEDFKKEWM